MERLREENEVKVAMVRAKEIERQNEPSVDPGIGEGAGIDRALASFSGSSDSLTGYQVGSP